jgi:hypothetical protein
MIAPSYMMIDATEGGEGAARRGFVVLDAGKKSVDREGHEGIHFSVPSTITMPSGGLVRIAWAGIL